MKRKMPVPSIVLVTATALAAVPLLALAAIAISPDPAPPPVAAGLAALAFVLALPGTLVSHVAMGRRRNAERRARRLSTAVGVAHAVGSTLDQVEVFREVFRQVRSVLPVDAFFVAIADVERGRLSYRFLVDDSRELEPTERDLAETLAGLCIERGEPILLRDAEHDRERLGIPRAAWGTVEERSIVVAPMRIRGEIIGAISAQSVLGDAYDHEDVELMQDIASEAAIAIERAELHERTARLSRRLFELHRVGVELVSQRDVGALARRLSAAAVSLVGGRAAVYIDGGGDTLVRADPDPTEREGLQTLPKRGTATERALVSGVPVEIGSPADLPDQSRRLVEQGSTRSIVIQPLRAAEESVGVLYVAWPETHRFTDEERELMGIVAGIGATALRSLRLYGELVGGHVRNEDVPARYGGDEFAIIMPETGREEAEKAVQRLMELLDRSQVDLGSGTAIPMLARSWGVATFPGDGRTAKALVEKADRSAYAQKRAR